MAIDIMRDPTDLRPGSNRQCFPCDKFENQSWAIGNNYNVSSHVFLPEELKFFTAAGWDEECRNPVYNPYVGFDLNELFNGTYTEGLVPTYDPDYNCPGQ
jgi:hypothetical protein